MVTAQRIFEIIKNTVIPERSYRESRNRLKLSSGFPLKIRGNDRQDYLHTLSSYYCFYNIAVKIIKMQGRTGKKSRISNCELRIMN